MIYFVFSGRADAAPLYPVIEALTSTGERSCVIPLPSCGDPTLGYTLSANRAANEFSIRKPSVVVVLGDRYEVYAAAGAATMCRVPVAHIHGGEVTEGSFDDSLRNAISQLAEIHFVSAPQYGERLKSMGRDNIHVVGAPGLDNVHKIFTEYKEKKSKREKRLVVTYHPATRTEETVLPLLMALERFDDYEIVFTGVNTDPGGEIVDREIVEFSSHRPRVQIHRGMMAGDYLHMCMTSTAVVGNSSAGLIEVPSLETPTVDIGKRQVGRLRGPSVFHAENNDADIAEKIRLAQKYNGPFDNPHIGPGASEKIADILIRRYGESQVLH